MDEFFPIPRMYDLGKRDLLLGDCAAGFAAAAGNDQLPWLLA